ncbi:MAG: transcriptional regulator, partial [Candidatus Hodarchaeota archaeon]
TKLILPNDTLFTTSVRLTIMILLLNHKKINFTEMQKLLQLTPGNLDHHLRKLVDAHYVKTYKKLSSLRKPLTMVEITDNGKKDFIEYIKKFKDVLDNIVISSEANS